MGELLKMQFDDDREKFIAAMKYGDHTRDLQDIINLAQNLDCYWLYPSVQSEEDYGHYLIEELDELELPEEAKKYFMYEEYGRDAAINDGGRFTEQGYIYNNRNTFTEWYDAVSYTHLDVYKRQHHHRRGGQRGRIRIPYLEREADKQADCFPCGRTAEPTAV